MIKNHHPDPEKGHTRLHRSYSNLLESFLLVKRVFFPQPLVGSVIEVCWFLEGAGEPALGSL
jgi:hypothetical protein